MRASRPVEDGRRRVASEQEVVPNQAAEDMHILDCEDPILLVHTTVS